MRAFGENCRIHVVVAEGVSGAGEGAVAVVVLRLQKMGGDVRGAGERTSLPEPIATDVRIRNPTMHPMPQQTVLSRDDD